MDARYHIFSVTTRTGRSNPKLDKCDSVRADQAVVEQLPFQDGQGMLQLKYRIKVCQLCTDEGFLRLNQGKVICLSLLIGIGNKVE